MIWVVLIALLTTALVRAQSKRNERVARLPPRTDPRWADEPRRQLAGRSCAECGVKIVTAGEGAPCESCDEVAHAETCLAQHMRSAHGAAPQLPYR